MDLYASGGRSIDDKNLVTVAFERETSDAAAPTIEVVFEVFVPGGVIDPAPPTLFMLSVTRRDTREAISLRPEERAAVCEKASEYAHAHSD